MPLVSIDGDVRLLAGGFVDQSANGGNSDIDSAPGMLRTGRTVLTWLYAG